MRELYFVGCNVPEDGWMTWTCCLCKHIWDCVMVKVIKNVISTFMDGDGDVCPVSDMDWLITRWKFHQDSWNSDWMVLNVTGVKYCCAILLGFLTCFGFNWLKIWCTEMLMYLWNFCNPCCYISPTNNSKNMG
jgi:hypothetical protein